MAFDSKDTAAFKDVWVFCEQRDGEIMSISHQLLSEGRKLADDLGANLCGILLGKGISEEDAKAMIVSGFANPVSKELPLEYAVEMNNLIKLEMSGNM